jgi:hypothetical protein
MAFYGDISHDHQGSYRRIEPLFDFVEQSAHPSSQRSAVSNQQAELTADG